MATLATVLAFSRAQAQTDSVGLTDVNGIIFANEALLDFHRRLISGGIDASQLQESYADGTASVGTYLYPTDMFFLKSIELNYTDTIAQNYRRAEQIDIANIPGGQSFGWVRTNQSTANPLFDDRGDWYEIFPTPITGNNITSLIRLFYYLSPTEYTTTADTISYPVKLDYRILGWRIAADYYYSLNKMDEGDKFNLKYEERVKQLIATLGRGSAQPIQATTIPLTGFEF